MKSKEKDAVCVIESQLPLDSRTVAALSQSIQEWIELLTDADCDACPAYFATAPKEQKITPELEKQIQTKYGWRPKYIRLIWI